MDREKGFNPDFGITLEEAKKSAEAVASLISDKAKLLPGQVNLLARKTQELVKDFDKYLEKRKPKGEVR
jgi:hypothetical protein